MKISDKQLYQLCKKYGARARLWRQRFAGLLPEVFRRRLYEKKGFGSIFEFAAKLAGMSEKQVRRVLNLEDRFEKLLILKTMLEEGAVSVNKLARVASVVSAETQEFWSTQMKVLPQRALETLVRDEKSLRCEEVNGLNKTQNEDKNVHVHTQLPLNLSPEIQAKLFKLQQKGIDINELLNEFLESREKEIEEEKVKLAAETKSTSSRYIPVATRELLQKEHGTKCSVDWCMKDAEEIHHTQRFSLTRRHNPRYLAPLCEEHHAIAHSIDLKIHARYPAAAT